MQRGKISQTLALALIAAASVNCLPAEGNEPKSSPPDNSGRRLAQVMPAATPCLPPAVHPVAASVPSVPSWTAALDRLNAHANQAADAAGERLSSLSPPLALTPAGKEALLKGAAAAQGLSRLAAKRFADFASWGAVLFHNLNEPPRLTPATNVAPLPLASARPDAGPEKAAQQLF